MHNAECTPSKLYYSKKNLIIIMTAAIYLSIDQFWKDRRNSKVANAQWSRVFDISRFRTFFLFIQLFDNQWNRMTYIYIIIKLFLSLIIKIVFATVGNLSPVKDKHINE
ncbi:hypothetical protein BpHYR1_014375 [Brachionus plicatilis]|uniref:Uncharacterized protein n=1 Tax=Brachionus plicatilis TaxID=10195 RepID=A0A3M7RL73_BRAPC|nr:hypothetical protein BpHYR1_014375 [Brachionus plicatilis]